MAEFDRRVTTEYIFFFNTNLKPSCSSSTASHQCTVTRCGVRPPRHHCSNANANGAGNWHQSEMNTLSRGAYYSCERIAVALVAYPVTGDPKGRKNLAFFWGSGSQSRLPFQGLLWVARKNSSVWLFNQESLNFIKTLVLIVHN